MICQEEMEQAQRVKVQRPAGVRVLAIHPAEALARVRVQVGARVRAKAKVEVRVLDKARARVQAEARAEVDNKLYLKSLLIERM